VSNAELESFYHEIGGGQLVRLDPDAMRQPCPLTRLDAPATFLAQRGLGLAGVLSAIYMRGEEEPIAHIRNEVKRLFPALTRVGPTSLANNTVELEAGLVDGTIVRASELSEGLLYYLAFFVLQYLESVQILLIEEPENGLHPTRIVDVVRVLRHLAESRQIQVIMATHSPLVINELKPEEVSVVTRPNAEQGTIVTPISQTPNFEARSKVLNLGELWLSYADGKDEAPLFESLDSQRER
jgi:predicted ATPase